MFGLRFGLGLGFTVHVDIMSGPELRIRLWN